MPNFLRCGLLLFCAVSAFGQARQEIAFINGTASAEEAVIYADGSLKLTGGVELYAEQLGPENTSATLKADIVTVLLGKDAAGELAISKMFARGQVDIVAHQSFPEAHETRDMTSQCDYLIYLAEDQSLTLETNDAEPVEATVDIHRNPPAAEGEEPNPQRYTFKLTGREFIKYLLTKPEAGELELRNEG